MLKGFYLTLLLGPVIPVPAPQPVIDALKGVQVTVSAGQRSGFQLSFGLSKSSLIQTALIPAGFFDPGIRVIIMVTVNSIPNVIMDGIITRQEVSQSNELGQSTLTVTGEDVSVLMDLIEIPLPLPMPVEARVALLIAKYALFGLVPLVIPTIFPDIPIPIDRIPLQKGTDLSYINQLAKENGYVFYIVPGPAPGMNLAYFGPEIRIGIPQSALNVNMDQFTNVESLSFSFDGLSREQPVVLIQEPITKLTLPIPVPPLSLLSPPLAVRQAPSLKIKIVENTAKLIPPLALAKGLAQANQSADAVSASGQLDVIRYGQPLSARGLVGVRGAGLGYDGLYYVKSVTHNIKPGEYKQSFTLSRNGLVSITPTVPT